MNEELQKKIWARVQQVFKENNCNASAFVARDFKMPNEREARAILTLTGGGVYTSEENLTLYLGFPPLKSRAIRRLRFEEPSRKIKPLERPGTALMSWCRCAACKSYEIESKGLAGVLPKLMCQDCGHVYRSNSYSAWELWRKNKKAA